MNRVVPSKMKVDKRKKLQFKITDEFGIINFKIY